MNNKKGYIQDLLLFGVIILLLATTFVVVNLFLKEINTQIQGTDMGTTAKSIMSDNTSRFSIVWNNNFTYIFFIFALAIIVGFYMIDTMPALFFPMVIILGFIIFIFAIIGNVYDAFDDDPTIATSASDFGTMGWIMSHPVELLVVIGFLGITALFAKNYLT